MFIVGNKQSRARWVLDYPSLPSLGLVSSGMIIGSLSLSLGILDESFGLIMTRNVLELASRVLITIGMVGSYYPLSNIKQVSTMDSPRPSSALGYSPRRPARETGMTIGRPVVGSFIKMDASTTQSFHHQSLIRATSRGAGPPRHDRVVSRHVSRPRDFDPKLTCSRPIADQSSRSRHPRLIKRIYAVWQRLFVSGID